MQNLTDIDVYSHRKCTLSGSLSTILIFFAYHTPLLYNAFSMSNGIVTMETTDATHAHITIFHAHNTRCQGSIALVPASAHVQYIP